VLLLEFRWAYQSRLTFTPLIAAFFISERTLGKYGESGMAIVLAVLGAVLPCLGIVALLRRSFVPVSSRIVAIAMVLSGIFVGAGLLTNRVPVPLDDPVRGFPYRGVLGHEVRVGNGLTNDAVRQMLPWMQVVRDDLFRGSLPLWNKYQFSGYPLLANGQSAPLSPIFLATLFVPLPKQLVAMAFIKLFVAFLFTWLFLRDDGRSHGAALFGAVVFAFSVFQTVYLYYPLTSVTALFPMLLWSLRRTAQSQVWRWPALFSFCVAAAISGGHPESVVHLAIGAVLLIMIDALTGAKEWRQPRVWGRLIVATIVALGIAAPAWLPVLEQVRVSKRLYEIAAAGHAPSFPAASAWLALNPNGFGHPARGTWNWVTNYSMDAPTYAGLLALALAISAIAARNRRLWLLLGAIALLYVISMNWTPIGHALNAVPPLSFTANDRLRFVAVFFLAIVWERKSSIAETWLLSESRPSRCSRLPDGCSRKSSGSRSTHATRWESSCSPSSSSRPRVAVRTSSHTSHSHARRLSYSRSTWSSTHLPQSITTACGFQSSTHCTAWRRLNHFASLDSTGCSHRMLQCNTT
jgi:hypothetical protein